MAFPALASVDGSVSPTPDARIPPGDDGLLRGDGVFEVIRLYAGRPFALGEHLDRLERSAAAIELPVERAALEREISGLLEEFGDEEGQLRLVITRGGRRLAFTEPVVEHSESVSLASVDYTPTIILTGVKSLSYGANMQATRLAQATGADEALLVRPDGVVLEAPTSTIFWATPDGSLRTPALDTGILASITRDRLLGELDVEEGDYPLEDVLGASEAFLASTVREVQPISAVNGTELPAVNGPLSRQAGEAFAAVLYRELDPASTSTRG
jgi:branched-chain amino acid aminotransferase